VLLALSKFRDAGIQVAIDNYGIGYSAMADLKKFQVNCLKIDCSFIRDMASDANDLAIVEAIIAMAHKLGIQVIAEGVETAWQRDQLIAAGCDYAQGYFFAHPMPPKEMNRLLQQQSL
jgi:EAL domain-containing protein (putative c-di-GMP-specific phosphodiesterase class I)